MILDTNALSAWLDGDAAIHARLNTADAIALSPIALGEYRFGVLQSRHRARYEEQLVLIEAEFPPLVFGSRTARHYSEIRLELRRAGHPIPWHDLWIAAQAREYALPVLSRDEHFDAVAGLTRLSW